jgi:hypothetical protein
MTFNPTLADSYQVNKDLKNFDDTMVVTYYVYKVIDKGLLFMYAADTFGEAKNWVQADMDRA